MKELLNEIKSKYPGVFWHLLSNFQPMPIPIDELKKEEYHKWFIKEYFKDFHDLECFFDDNEIYISMRFNTAFFIYEIIESNPGEFIVNDESEEFDSRTEATKSAILKACEILENELNNEDK